MKTIFYIKINENKKPARLYLKPNWNIKTRLDRFDHRLNYYTESISGSVFTKLNERKLKKIEKKNPQILLRLLYYIKFEIVNYLPIQIIKYFLIYYVV